MKFAAVSVAIFCAGCTVSSNPFTQDENRVFGVERVTRATANQEPITGSITLYEAMARALKYNLDTRVELMEAALRVRERDLASYDMLPNLVASTGYAGRDNTDVSSVTTADDDVVDASLEFSWNILDFGLSYVRAKQASDKALMQEEMKRKIVNRTIEDVRTSYWRAVSYQRLIGRMRGLEGRIDKALRDTRQLSESGETSALLALTYERELIEIRRDIERMEGELQVAQSQLAALMNVRPGTNFTLSPPPRGGTKLGVPNDLSQMYQIAVTNRPEMREVAYQMRINEKEVDAALLDMLPGINLYAGSNYDSNEFIDANDWVSWGAQVSWNLLDVARGPANRRRVDAEAAALDARSLSVAMAIMTQVQISRLRYGHLNSSYQTAASLSNVSHRILDQVEAEASADRTSEQVLIREEMNALVADAELDMAYADLQNAYANVYASLGIDPFPRGLSLEDNVQTVAAQLQNMWEGRGSAPTQTVAAAN
ncbi:TolC family protein [Qingshengfaniella alkalisoli]|uniref:TolC family protein n=1 Tax=Qingshengfaniella alkalisoli TaxID=2599296 RepID=A0A5B8IVQ2_9RHOB|nr:TolC family protein [Qingshengfaniella alkalisoli]QDY69704.1 TolC family protein [Qingshengfaniella alkalisoli]